MYKIPGKLASLPEAKRLLQAQEEFEAALKEEELLNRKERQMIHLISERMQRAQDELRKAGNAFDAATGEYSSPPPLPHYLMTAFQRSVEKHFTPVAQSLDSRLERLSHSLYGFVTRHGVVTVGVYHGHSPSVCVTLRERKLDEKLSVDDQRDIGLANIITYAHPSAQQNFTPYNDWTERSLDDEIMTLASDLSRYGRSFLVDPSADWVGLREWLRAKIEKSLAEMPWLKKFSQNA